MYVILFCCFVLFFQAEDGIRDLVRSRGLGDVYKRQEGHLSLREMIDRKVKAAQTKGLIYVHPISGAEKKF